MTSPTETRFDRRDDVAEAHIRTPPEAGGGARRSWASVRALIHEILTLEAQACRDEKPHTRE